MPIYFLSEEHRRNVEDVGRSTFLSEPALKGEFALFNKNDFTTLHVKVIERTAHRHGWLVECETVPPYFRHVLR